MTHSFDPSTYWRQRVTPAAGVEVVGHRTQGRAFNAWLYRRRRDVLAAAVAARAGRSGRPATAWTVCELGFGGGHWLAWWQAQPVARLTGVDVSAQAVASARERFPGVELREADLAAVAEPALPLAVGAADVVTLFDVLYHVVDDAAAGRLLHRAARLLRPDGELWVFENPLPHTVQLRPHVRYRSRALLEHMCRDAGLEMVAEEPLFLALCPPGTGRVLPDFAIAAAYAGAGLLWRTVPRLGETAGRLAYGLDRRWLGQEAGRRLATHRLWVLRRIPPPA